MPNKCICSSGSLNDYPSVANKLVSLRRIFLINLFVLVAALITSTTVLELLLQHTTLLDQTDSPIPSYIPRKFKLENAAITQTGLTDQYGFRSADGHDHISHLTMPGSEKCRVVVLGDSFVWGDGLRVEDRWPDKLSALSNCRITSFGINGWTTLEEFAFYEKHLKDLYFDYLLIGLVDNDPHPKGHYAELALQPKHYVLWHHLIEHKLPKTQIIKMVFPLSYHYITSIYNKYRDNLAGEITLNKPDGTLIRGGWGYTNWRNRLFKDDILNIWKDAVSVFQERSAHPFAFVLTPTDASQHSRPNFDKLTRILDEMDIKYADCFPEVEALFGTGLRPRSAWANPANGHPGAQLTQKYAECADSHLTMAIE